MIGKILKYNLFLHLFFLEDQKFDPSGIEKDVSTLFNLSTRIRLLFHCAMGLIKILNLAELDYNRLLLFLIFST